MRDVTSAMNQSEPEATSAKGGKTHATKSRLVLVLLLIGWESGASFLLTNQGEVKQNQDNYQITFDTQLKNVQ